MRRDLPELTAHARRLDYFPIIINTNGSLLHRFTHPERGECLVGWALDGATEIELPSSIERVVTRDGSESTLPSKVILTGSPQYFWFRSL